MVCFVSGVGGVFKPIIQSFRVLVLGSAHGSFHVSELQCVW